MKRKMRTITLTTIAGLSLLFNTVWAADHSGHEGHSHGAQTTDMSGHEGHGQKASQPSGQLIAEKKADGYVLNYYLHDMAARNKMMKSMEGMEMHGMSSSPDITNHLMLFIKDAQGKSVSGKVGFIVIGPDGKESKTLTMGMGGGYGADISLKQPGEYRIKTKAVIDGKTIADEFAYTVK